MTGSVVIYIPHMIIPNVIPLMYIRSTKITLGNYNNTTIYLYVKDLSPDGIHAKYFKYPFI